MTSEMERQLGETIAAMSRQYPDWRFGQIVANLATLAHGEGEGAVWELTDEKFIAAAAAHLAKRAASPSQALPA